MSSGEFTDLIALPEHPFRRGIGRMLDWHGAFNRDVVGQILERHPIHSMESSAEDTEPNEGDIQAAWKADAEAMRADWEAVGDCLRWAIGEYDRSLCEKNTG